MKFKYTIVVFLFLSIPLLSQNSENKWVFGLDIASANYSNSKGNILGGSFIKQSPRISLARYMFSNITFVGSFSTSFGAPQKYVTYDGLARYDFGTSQNNVVPYVLFGGSFIKARALTPTVNFGAGNTLWLSNHFGFNFQFLYKFSEDKFTSQKSHIMLSFGLVYSLEARILNPRFWNQHH